MAECEIVLRGVLSEDALPELAGFDRSTADGVTVLHGTVESEDDLPTILQAFAALGLGLTSLRVIPGPTGDAPTSPRPIAG